VQEEVQNSHNMLSCMDDYPYFYFDHLSLPQKLQFPIFASGDASLRITTNKLANITAEVDSLKAVLEIKSEELRGLRADKIRLEEKLVDFDQMRASLQKATALCEDLKAQIDTKNNLERLVSIYFGVVRVHSKNT